MENETTRSRTGRSPKSNPLRYLYFFVPPSGWPGPVRPRAYGKGRAARRRGCFRL